MSVAVIGAGVVGLMTATHIQDHLPQVRVTVIADKFNSETTSDGAAGLFLPASNFRGPTPSTAKEWMVYSYKYYDKLVKENCGVFETSGFLLSSISEEHVQNELMVGVTPEYRPATAQELLQYPGNWKYGTFMKTLTIRCRTFLPWLLNRIKERGGRVINKKIHDLTELAGEYDVVVNCTGLQAKWLSNDPKLAPIRGQLIKVRSPVNQFIFGDSHDVYIIPNGDGLVSLGGTCQFNIWETNIRPHDTKWIRDRCSALIPSLASAPVAWEWVGLRPYRDTVRVEPEIINGLKIVHNYGHGGYGVTSAPGSAKDATSLVSQLLNLQPKM